MSIEAMSRVWKLHLPRSKQGVLLAMTDHGDDKGASIFPSTGLIAWKCGLSERQVQRLIREMEVDGLLVRVAEAHGHRPTEYRVEWSAAIEKPEYRAEDRRKARERRGVNLTPQEGRHADAPSDSSSQSEMSPPGTTSQGHRDDTQMSPRTLDPPGEPPVENGPTSSLRSRDDLVELSNRLADGIRQNDGKAKVAPESKTWLEPLRLLLDADCRSVEEVQAVIDFAVEDEFERRVVLSPQKLRKRFGELVQKAHAAAPTTDGPVQIGFRRDAGPRRSARAQATAEFDPAWLAAHPRTPELDAEWTPIADELRASVDESTFRIWLGGLHLHDAGEQLVIGVHGHAKGWVHDRFGRLIEAAAGKPYRLVVCACDSTRAAA
jgi:DNA-binding Lrp family transcriptional regulator